MIRSISTNQQVNKSTGTHSNSPLGSLLIHEPTSTYKGLERHVINAEGVITNKKEIKEIRSLRFERQSGVRKLLPTSKTAQCLRTRIHETVKVLKSQKHDKCHFTGLMTCGSVWSCPVCAAKISERRRSELKLAVDQHQASGGSVVLVTFTTSHKREDDLSDLLAKQSKASQWFYRHRTYKEIKSRYMKRGRVRALEVNHSQANGWHPHMHELWFLNLNLHDYSVLKAEIFSLWLKACNKYKLGLPSEKYGVDVRGGDHAVAYVSKYGLEDKATSKHVNRSTWGLEDELTKSMTKKGRNGSRSAFQLIDDYLLGDKQSGALFAEYFDSFKGKRQLTWSRCFKAEFDLEEKTDEVLASEQEDESELLLEINANDWKNVLRSSTPFFDARAIILQLAENGGPNAVNTFIHGLSKPENIIH